jgi:uncharacterized membrane protein
MTKYLTAWIDSTQADFVLDRCIFENLFLTFEALFWRNKSNQPFVMLLLDFEKVYDRLSWRFLEETRRSMGFHDTWISWIWCLYKSLESSVLLNGHPGITFNLE